MPAKAQSPPSSPQKIARFAVLVLAVIGLGNAIYSLVSHLTYVRSGQLGGYCDISARYNCGCAIGSAESKLIGVPVPVYAIGFYAGVVLAATIALSRKNHRVEATWSWLLLCFAGAVAYSAYLFSILVEMGCFCPACLVLDAVNLLSLVAVAVAIGGGPAGALSRVGETIRHLGTPAFLFSLAFAVAFLAGQWLSSSTGSGERPARFTVDTAYDLVVDYPTRQTLDGAAFAPRKGAADPGVLIIEFSDFQCPYCRRLADSLHRLVAAYPDDVQLRFMHYPLHHACNPNTETEMHPNACIAAEAAVCAEAQGRFWEMHDLLFANQRRFTRQDVLELADRAGLDRGEFVECLDGPDSLERVRSDSIVGFQAVESVGLESIGTPYFFVNGLLVRGAQPYPDIEALVRRELLERGRTEEDPESGALLIPRDERTLAGDWRQLRRAGGEQAAPAAPHP